MERHGIPRRSQRESVRQYPELGGLEIDQAVEVPRRDVTNIYVAYYDAASYRGIRVSVQVIGPDLVRITGKA